MTLASGTRLGPYEILAPIGAGGMGEVYRARDKKLDRDVAIKVLPASVATDPGALARFEREAKAVAALSHPNILSIFDFGTHDATSYAVMELLEGETLRERLVAGPIPQKQAVDYALQIAMGLSAAHERGVVHRDLKPENLFVTRDGHLKILDFGLAKKVEAVAPGDETSAPTGSGQTVPGIVMGTVGYMSPEQARGAAVDFRSDQFSFGSILYEMLAGERPFQAETSHQVLAATIEDNPTPIGDANPTVPEPLRWIVQRCLAKAPIERYGSTRDLAHDLRRVLEQRPEPTLPVEAVSARRPSRPGKWAALTLALVLVVGGALYLTHRPGVAVRSLAVLPFGNSSPDPNAQYLSDGITDSLISSLSQLPKLQVMAHSTVFSFKGRAVDPRRVGRDLGVGAVLTGQMTQRADTLIVTAELVDVRSGARLWGERYNRRLSDIFAVQDEIASEIAENLKLRLTGEERRKLAKRYTENAEAYQAYLKGRYFAGKYTEEGWKKAFDYFHRAIEIDPTYALAYAGLTVACWDVSNVQKAPREVMPEGREAARKAVELDDNLAEAHASLALVEMAYDWDRAAAEREYKKAITLNPGYASAYQWYGWHLALLGRTDEAITEMQKAQQLDPLSAEISAFVGLSLYWSRQYRPAIDQLQKSLELDPNAWFTRILLGWAYLQNHQVAEALGQIQRARELDDNAWTLADLGHAYAVSANPAEARRILIKLEELSKRRYVSKYFVARIYAGLGENDRAFQWMEKAFEDRDESETWLKVDPMMDELRSDPRYADLLRRLGLV
jgi:serine/threonine protein kinase/tetratricopeptide (TPR) repeat protein